MPITITDALGSEVTVPTPPQRIVSLVPSLTELLADLGMDERMAGITKFCVRPAAWYASKPRIGGTKNVNVERVRALRPDLVLANKEENERAQVEAIRSFTPVFVTDITTVAECAEAIRAIGEVVDARTAADALAADTIAAFADLQRLQPAKRVPAAYLIWRDPWMTVGSDTIIHDVMARAGLDNVFGERSRYPEVSSDELAASGAQVVLLSSEPFPFAEKHISEIRSLVPNADVRLVDGEMFSWYGSRLRHAPRYLLALRRAMNGSIP